MEKLEATLVEGVKTEKQELAEKAAKIESEVIRNIAFSIANVRDVIGKALRKGEFSAQVTYSNVDPVKSGIYGRITDLLRMEGYDVQCWQMAGDRTKSILRIDW